MNGWQQLQLVKTRANYTHPVARLDTIYFNNFPHGLK
jgi:hypothetical protein